MKQITNRFFLCLIFLAPALCSAQTPQPAEVAQPKIEMFRNCVVGHFTKEVARTSDKEAVFNKVFKLCGKEEAAMLEALNAKKSHPTEEIDALKVTLRKNLKKELSTFLKEHIDDLLRRAAYISELSTCDGADTQVISTLREGLVDEMYSFDKELEQKNLLRFQVEYYRILIRVNISEIGTQKWCQEQKALLKKGYAQKQIEFEIYKE